ncbi:hypothetical protein Tco_0707022 [Tanacetum coccineum]|uniref:Integrase, catalytic region, zinc finger, CCHC-type, peptidase aspartic, catalytic n=1 Tax=Tanacetum coccineum TaxID=301880 RepID=A0ABQ4YA38_9ASTR
MLRNVVNKNKKRVCKLYDEFDKFTYKKGETLHEYYLRFTMLLNDMNIYKMPLEQFQVNTKFLNTLPDEWSKFVTDVKLVKDLHTTNVDQLHAYLQQHERHANEVRLMHERNSDPLALVASHQLTQPAYQSHLHTHPKSLSQRKYYKISYDKTYNDMQQKIDQLGDLKGKSKDTPCVSDTLDPLSQKLENENVELEFQVLNYAIENAHLKTTYKNLFDSINVTRTQTKSIIDYLQEKLHNMIYENAKLRAQLFDKVSKQQDTTHGTSVNTKFIKQSILRKPSSSSKSKLYSVTPFPNSKVISKVRESNALLKPVTSNSAPSTQESKAMKNDNVIAPGMFRINPSKTSRVDNVMHNKLVKASVRTKPITTS